MVFAQEPQFPRYQDKMKEYQYASKKISTEYIDPEKKPSVAQAEQRSSSTATIVFNYKGRTERVNADGEQDITNAHHQGRVGPAAEDLLHAGPRRKGHRPPSERDGYNAIATALGRENYTVDKLAHRADRARCPTMRRWWSSPGRRTTSSRRKSTR